MARLSVILGKDSQTSSKPPSTDIIKRLREKESTRRNSTGTAKAETSRTTRSSRKNSFWVWQGRQNRSAPSRDLYSLGRNSLSWVCRENRKAPSSAVGSPTN
ncbi:hypothetical protein [Moorena sp. SIOASIH]|uniref:hypothetical protein n=1 Tax=Moorena sp. SIOASIH TaxID=2607817 RepID=UPI00344CB6D5